MNGGGRMKSDKSCKLNKMDGLLRDKDSILNEIKTQMALKAYNKETMSEEQIDSFRDFYEAYTQNAEKMNTMLDEIEEALMKIIEFGKKTLCYI